MRPFLGYVSAVLTEHHSDPGVLNNGDGEVVAMYAISIFVTQPLTRLLSLAMTMKLTRHPRPMEMVALAS